MKTAKRLTALFLALILALGGLPRPAMAAETEADYITEGSFQFTSNDGKLHQGKDHFVFREDCFMRSSFLGCSHLALLSSQAAQASAGYVEGQNGYETDISQGSHNIEEMLRAMGFGHIESNAYFSIDSKENSCAVALGNRRLETGGKTYTLLAVFPRSMRYQQEWAGNFTVGGGNLHEGLKAARDEVLRFMKQYVENHEVQGDLKIWIAGHSRGGAVSNALGGFFAGGGVSYLGDALRLTPEDLYCYTFAAPRPVKAGADRSLEMSVAGARKEADYAADTPGEAYISSFSGQLDPKAEAYGGIRNYVIQEDLIALLPPESWGFIHYGTDIVINELGAGFAEMHGELSPVSEYLVEDFDKSGGFDAFDWKSFDLANLLLVPYNGSYRQAGLVSFWQQRMQGLMARVEGNADYASGKLQETLAHAAALIILLTQLNAEDFALDGYASLIKPLVLTVLAYGSERLMEEGRAGKEQEALAIILAELINYYSESHLDPAACTVDEALGALAKYLADHEDSRLYQNLMQALAGVIPESLTGVVRRLLGIFHKDSSLFNPAPLEETLQAYIRACAYGADPECSAAGIYSEPADARELIFSSLSLLMGGDLKDIRDAIGSDGQGRLSDVMGALLPLFLQGTDEAGETMTYSSLNEAADEELTKLADGLLPPLMDRCGQLFGKSVKADMERHWQILRANIGLFRRTLCDTLLYTEGEPFRVEQALATACTMAGHGGLIPLAHYNEVYSAWLKAAGKVLEAEEHYIVHVDGKAADKQNDGLREHWCLVEKTGERYFTDRNLSQELGASELIIPKETEPPTTQQPSESAAGEGSTPQKEPAGDSSAQLPPQTAPDEQNDQEKGPVVLYVALGLLAAGGALAGGLMLAKKKKEEEKKKP